MAPEWEAKEPRQLWADARVLGFQCVLREGLSKGPRVRAVSVTVIFMVKTHDGKYKKVNCKLLPFVCVSRWSLSGCPEGINTRLCASLAIRYAPRPPKWTGTVGPEPSRMTAAVLSQTTEWDTPPYITQSTIFITTLRDFIYLLNFILGQGLTMQPTRTHNHLASASQGLRLQARTTMAGFFFNVGPRVWTRVLMLKKQALSTYGDISQVSLWDS